MISLVMDVRRAVRAVDRKLLGAAARSGTDPHFHLEEVRIVPEPRTGGDVLHVEYYLRRIGAPNRPSRISLDRGRSPLRLTAIALNEDVCAPVRFRGEDLVSFSIAPSNAPIITVNAQYWWPRVSADMRTPAVSYLSLPEELFRWWLPSPVRADGRHERVRLQVDVSSASHLCWAAVPSVVDRGAVQGVMAVQGKQIADGVLGSELLMANLYGGMTASAGDVARNARLYFGQLFGRRVDAPVYLLHPEDLRGHSVAVGAPGAVVDQSYWTPEWRRRGAGPYQVASAVAGIWWSAGCQFVGRGAPELSAAIAKASALKWLSRDNPDAVALFLSRTPSHPPVLSLSDARASLGQRLRPGLTEWLTGQCYRAFEKPEALAQCVQAWWGACVDVTEAAPVLAGWLPK